MNERVVIVGQLLYACRPGLPRVQSQKPRINSIFRIDVGFSSQGMVLTRAS